MVKKIINFEDYKKIAENYHDKNGIKIFGIFKPKNILYEKYETFIGLEYKALNIDLFHHLYREYIQHIHNKDQPNSVLTIFPKHNMIGILSKFKMKDYKIKRPNIIRDNPLWQEAKFVENDFFCLLDDYKPRANIHKLLVPTKFYADFGVFLDLSSREEQEDLISTLIELQNKYKDHHSFFVTNIGTTQSVPFLHFHIIVGDLI